MEDTALCDGAQCTLDFRMAAVGRAKAARNSAPWITAAATAASVDPLTSAQRSRNPLTDATHELGRFELGRVLRSKSLSSLPLHHRAMVLARLLDESLRAPLGSPGVPAQRLLAALLRAGFCSGHRPVIAPDGDRYGEEPFLGLGAVFREREGASDIGLLEERSHEGPEERRCRDWSCVEGLLFL